MSGTVLLILAVAMLAALLLFGRRDRARRVGHNENRTTARQRMAAIDPRLPEADLAEIGRLRAEGRKIEAIKLVRQKTGLGLAEAKEFVEHHDFRTSAAAAGPAARAAEQKPRAGSGPWAAEEAPAPGAGLSPADHAEVARELADGRKIRAIRLVRERTGMGLKEAKDFIEGPAFDTR